MKIAIHHNPGSFSERWIEYCKDKGIDYKIVNAYDNDVTEQVKDCDAFMWHHHHANYKDVLFAKQLLYSLQMSGIKVFPNFNTGWHFDDKVGQKYLLEAIEAPLVPSYVFYTKEEALKWIETTTFPKVFKLRGGAGSQNVLLAHNKKEAKNFVEKAFGKGFPQSSISNKISEDRRHLREGKMNLYGFIKDIAAYYLKKDTFRKMQHPEKGYAYFQDYIPNNSFDIRVCVVGDKAFAIKRMVRENDFRASGSGHIIYAVKEIPLVCVKISFDMVEKLKTQCIAIDYVFDKDGQPKIVEISYGFAMHGYDSCPGYWTKELNWHEETFNPQYWMIEDLIGYE